MAPTTIASARARLYGSSHDTLAISSASASDRVAPPNVPARMPTMVMPICTVERKRVGSSARVNAMRAGVDPSSASFFNRARREETTEISAMANTPLASRSRKMIRISTSSGFMEPK